MSNDSLQSRLQTYYQSNKSVAKQTPQISGLTSITTGWEHEMYAFDIEHGPAENRRRDALVLRLYSGGDAQQKAEQEFHSMELLHAAGYPVPRVDAIGSTASPVGAPFIIMERIDGQLLGSLLAVSPEEKRRELRTTFCALLLRLHSMDWRAFADYGADYETRGPYAFVDRQIELERAALQRQSLPGFLPVVDWLQERRGAVPCARPSIVHGDYHPNNVMLRRDGAPVVIDWSSLHVSDPRIDLGWMSLLLRTHVGIERRNYMLQEYQRQAGAEIECLEWFETLTCLWRLRPVVLLFGVGAEQAGLHSAAAALVKEQLEPIRRVYELLQERTAIRVPEVERMLASEIRAVS